MRGDYILRSEGMLNHSQGNLSDSQNGCELKLVYLSFLVFEKEGEKKL